jgi:hypothetical protein
MNTLPRNLARRGDRGTILVITMIVSGILTLMSMSFGMTVRTAVAQAREAEPALHAELAAHSAVDYALRQLLFDSDWDGTGQEMLPLEGGTGFTVRREPVLSARPPIEDGDGNGHAGPDTDPTETYLFTLTGSHGMAEATLEMVVRISSMDPIKDQAFAVLGGAVDLQHLSVSGNMLITDELGFTLDYIPDPLDPSTGTWEEGGVDFLGDFDFDHVDISGSLSKYSTNTYTDGREITIWQEIQTPSWYLEPYLEPAPDRVILTDVTALDNQHFTDLVVLVNPPGDQIRIRECVFENGIVVYAEPDWDMRGVPRNELYLKKPCFFGSETSSTHIGILAPATEVVTPGTLGHPPTMIGTTYIHSLNNVMGGTISGQLIALNSVEHIMHTTFTYDPELAQWPPDGFDFGGEDGKRIQVLGLRELFPDEDIPIL